MTITSNSIRCPFNNTIGRTEPSLRISCCFFGLTCFLKMWLSMELWLWFFRNSSTVSTAPLFPARLGKDRAWAVARNASRDRGHTDGYL